MQKLKDFLKVHKEYYHILFLPVYLISFFIVERVVPTEGYWVSYLPLDDKIPFVDWFVVFYALWYPLLLFTGVFALFKKEKDVFCRYMIMMEITFMGTLLFSLLFPNGQDLRPATFEKNNVFTWLIGKIYASDTNTNVLPSMHVLGCLSCMYASFDSKEYPWWSRVLIAVLSVLICASTVLIKQHSILDLFVAVPVSLVVGAGVYGKRILSAVKAKKAQKSAAATGVSGAAKEDFALTETENQETSVKIDDVPEENRPVTLPLYGGKPVAVGEMIADESKPYKPAKTPDENANREAELSPAKSKIPSSSAEEETAAEDD